MSKFSDDLIQSLKEALAHAKGGGPGVVHAPTGLPIREANDAQANADNAIEKVN